MEKEKKKKKKQQQLINLKDWIKNKSKLNTVNFSF